ncbi:Mor transcription activator family protein [Castellaniella hirudinis]|uniref:Mor transcription activator family protein n=1 Tax=Castellaniella hirudinis TaxID=1144617 RepID=UPI0039C12440
MSKKSTRMEHVRHELYTDIIETVAKEVEELGYDRALGEMIGTAVVNCLMDKWPGQYIVFPMDQKYLISIRDMEIYESHRGDFSETSKRWGLTQSGIRKVIDRVTKRLIDQNQNRLF